MKELVPQLNELPEFRSLLEAVQAGKQVVSVYGMSPVHKAHFAAALQAQTGRPLLLVTRDEGQARRLAADFTHFSGVKASLLPAREYVFHNIDNASREFEHQRLGALDEFVHAKQPVLAAPLRSAADAHPAAGSLGKGFLHPGAG